MLNAYVSIPLPSNEREVRFDAVAFLLPVFSIALAIDRVSFRVSHALEIRISIRLLPRGRIRAMT